MLSVWNTGIGMERKLQKHINKLGKKLGCIVNQGQGQQGMMYVEEDIPRIEGPLLVADGFHPTPESAYLVMLHELGHVFHGHTQGRPPHIDKKFYFDNGVLHSEAQAWEFALDNSIIVPEGAESDFMWNTCLGSYYAGAYRSDGTKHNLRDDNRLYNGNRHWIPFAWDDADSYFYSIRDRILNKEGGV